MNYKTFIDSFSKVNDFSLPGISAQLLATPLHRRNEMPPASVYTKNAKRAAVLLFCYPKGDQMYLSLIKRSEYQGVHSGQISFPGGKSELSDASLEETALRECREELGVSLEAVALLSRMILKILIFFQTGEKSHHILNFLCLSLWSLK